MCVCACARIQVCVKGGLDEQMTKKLLTRSQEQDIKDKLKATTQEAFELGVRHPCVLNNTIVYTFVSTILQDDVLYYLFAGIWSSVYCGLRSRKT